MTADKLLFVVCENLKREVKAALETEGFEDVKAITFPAACHSKLAGWNELTCNVPQVYGRSDQLHLIAGPCCTQLENPPSELGQCRIHRFDHCSRLFADGPTNVLPVELEFLRLFLTKIVLEWRLQKERGNFNAALDNAKRQSANYALAVDLIGNLSKIMTEAEAVESIFDIFTILFAPSKLIYVPLTDGRPGNVLSRPEPVADGESVGNRLANLAEDYAWTESGNGFRVRINHQGEMLSVIEIDGIAFPAYKEQYLNVALLASEVCGLAISNARQYEKIKQMEELLATERNRLAVTLHSMGDAVIATDLEQRVVLLNHVAEKLTGWPQEKAIGMLLCEVFHIINEKTRQACENPVEKVLRNGTVVGLANHTALIAKDGTERLIADSAAPIRDGKGGILGVVLVFRDVTDLKRAEEERERLLLEVERHAAELDAANKELEAFAYSVSHDLRAPLRHIDGFSQILLEDYWDKLDDQGREYFHFIRRGSQRMAQLIDDMLKLSQVTRSEMRFESVDLSEMAQEILAGLRRQQPEREVEVTIAPEALAEGDPRLLRSTLENLLGNAWKFTSKCRTARIEFGVIKQNEKTIYFVGDNGAGFDMAYSDKLFGTFQRLHKEEEFPGTGIGLATVQRIIRRHGGRVWAQGKPNEGATFYFTLE